MKKPILAALSVTFCSLTFSGFSYGENVIIGCNQESNKVAANPMAGDQTAVCSDCTDKAPPDYGYFRNPETRITHQEGHHNEVGCVLVYNDPFAITIKHDYAGEIEVEVFREVCVHGKARATHTGETARIDCQAQVNRRRVTN